MRLPTFEEVDDFVDIVVLDEQSDEPVDPDRWRRLAEAVLVAQGVDGMAEMSVMFVDEAAIGELNGRFMGVEGPTDVLSFPLDNDADSGIDADADADGFIVVDAGMPMLLGDVVICPAVAARNAPEHAGTTEDEMALLIVHGILHLLGYDHMEDDERAVMWARERELLTSHHGELAGTPWS